MHNVCIHSVPTGGPQVVECNALNLTTLNVMWSEPHILEQNGPIEQYWVFVWNSDTNRIVYNNTFTSPTVTSVTSLDPYFNYKCSVAAYARGGLGPFSTQNMWLTDLGETLDHS